jgi:uncharacterized membrane protein
MAAWTGATFSLVRSDYADYRLGRFDLGNMAHAVWNTAHGRLLETVHSSGVESTRLASHVDPILALLAPLWIVAPSPLTLAAAQIVALALGALPVFWLARRHLGSHGLAVALALAYLLYPWLAWTARDAIHPVTFAIPLLLLCVWFLDGDRLAPFAAAAVLVLACGELMGVTLCALGLWYAFSRRRRRPGLVIAAAGLGWTFVALLVVVPQARGGTSAYYDFYESVGGSPIGLLETAFTDPGAILGQLFDPYVLVYVLALAAPLCGLFVLSPALALVGAPQLLVNSLADPVGPIDPRQHYLAAIVPFLFAATVLGIARVRPDARRPAVAAVLVLTCVTSVALSPLGAGRESAPLWYQVELPDSHVALLDRAMEVVPDDVPVSASNRVGARLVERRRPYTLPYVRGAEWIVFDTTDRMLLDERLPVLREWTREEVSAFAAQLRRDPRWTVVFEEGPVFVLRRQA